jgi:hypothetical protein
MSAMERLWSWVRNFLGLGPAEAMYIIGINGRMPAREVKPAKEWLEDLERQKVRRAWLQKRRINRKLARASKRNAD